jgi:hypothetical protein
MRTQAMKIVGFLMACGVVASVQTSRFELHGEPYPGGYLLTARFRISR